MCDKHREVQDAGGNKQFRQTAASGAKKKPCDTDEVAASKQERGRPDAWCVDKAIFWWSSWSLIHLARITHKYVMC